LARSFFLHGATALSQALDLRTVWSNYYLLRNIRPRLLWLDSPSGPGPPHCRGFTITLSHRTLLDEWAPRL